MNEFVTGVLELNEVGATDGHTVYDRWLTLRLANGTAIEIFDDQLISTDLVVGQMYDLVLIVAVPWEIRYLPSPPPHIDLKALEQNYVVRGVVLDPYWQATERRYRYMTAGFYKRVSVLLETAIGRLLVSRRNLEKDMQGPAEQVATGGYLEWMESRLDLLAVL